MMTCIKCGISSSTVNTAGLCEACNATPISYCGGPAFPHTDEGTYITTYENGASKFVTTKGGNGMTIRDWFAGMALQGMYASDRRDWNGQNDKPARASKAYEMADAMLEARKAVNHA